VRLTLFLRQLVHLPRCSSEAGTSQGEGPKSRMCGRDLQPRISKLTVLNRAVAGKIFAMGEVQNLRPSLKVEQSFLDNIILFP